MENIEFLIYEDFRDNRVKQMIHIMGSNKECFGTISFDNLTKIAILSNISVNPKYRGKGLSTILLHKMEEIIVNLNCEKITLQVRKNTSKLKDWYISKGYNEIFGYKSDRIFYHLYKELD